MGTGEGMSTYCFQISRLLNWDAILEAEITSKDTIVSIGGRLTEPLSILTEMRLEQLTEWLKNDWSKNT